MAVSIVVLAGGRSLRLGRDKLREIVGSQSLLERVIGKLQHLGDEIIVVGLADRLSAPLLSRWGVRRAEDIYPGKGSLGGLYTGLVTSHWQHSLVVGGDMPFLSVPLLRYMLELYDDFEVTVPRVAGLLEPLHAVYSKACLPVIERYLEQGKLRIPGFYPEVNVRYVEEAEVDRFDPEHLSFFNVNTAADLRKARALAKRLQTETKLDD